MPLSVPVSGAGDEKYKVRTCPPKALTALEEARGKARKVESELGAKLKRLIKTSKLVDPVFDEYLVEVCALGESQALASLSTSTFAMETAIETVSGATNVLVKVLGWAQDQRDQIADHIAKCEKRGQGDDDDSAINVKKPRI